MQTRARLPGTPEPMHRWPGADGLLLAGDAWGDPAAPLVLLLHGVGQTRHAWGGTARLLGAAGFHAVAMDARGHGDSDWSPDGDYSRDAMIRDLQCLTAMFGSGNTVLVGASMGGATSLVAVGEGHIQASALILVDIAPQTEPAGVAKVKAFMGRNSEGFESLEEVAEAINHYRPAQRQARKLDGLAKNVRLAPDGKYHWHWDPCMLARPRESNARRAESARRLRVPTLLVRGGHSDVVSEQGVQDFLALCPHAEYVNIADAGHMVAGDRNDAFGHAALEFLRPTAPG
jgi:pimeloyl-ACP methyl ester carboxylesterase